MALFVAGRRTKGPSGRRSSHHEAPPVPDSRPRPTGPLKSTSALTRPRQGPLVGLVILLSVSRASAFRVDERLELLNTFFPGVVAVCTGELARSRNDSGY